MNKSTDRILTTHVGSLPRPQGILDALGGGSPQLAELLPAAVADVVRRQVDAGIDIVTDGEYSKPSFHMYAHERLTGFEDHEVVEDAPTNIWATTKEGQAFPGYYARRPSPAGTIAIVGVGPISYVGHEALQRDIANLKAALEPFDVCEAFIPAISPVEIVALSRNEHYPSEEEYLFAAAEAMSEEYRAIVEAGLIVQIDDPSLLTQYMLDPDLTVEDCRRWARTRVEAINHALRGIPEERVRFHTCYSINIGPRVHDMELKDIVDVMLEVNASAYSFEAGNARHEHEWQIWKSTDLPEGKVLIPGVITNSSVLVEHPEVIADRIVRFASVVGRERVIAGADCGFASSANSDEFEEGIVWAKLASLTQGARLASARLW